MRKALIFFPPDRTSVTTPAGTFPTGDFTFLQLNDILGTLPPAKRGRELVARPLSADAFDLHHSPRAAGAVIQVASQFNCLEHPNPACGMLNGVSGYVHDRTQGPACALACPFDLLFRHYCAQSPDNQLDGTADLWHELRNAAFDNPWNMRNGYLLPNGQETLRASRFLGGLTPASYGRMRGLVRIGVTRGAWVARARQRVTQVYCSAIPMAYFGDRLPAGGGAFRPLARLFLEAAYLATLTVAATQQAQGGSGTVFLTRVGGGAFGNPRTLIDDALSSALLRMRGYPLDVFIVERG
jgi:hypothetical protein